jgi:hypothetical protein
MPEKMPDRMPESMSEYMPDGIAIVAQLESEQLSKMPRGSLEVTDIFFYGKIIEVDDVFSE